MKSNGNGRGKPRPIPEVLTPEEQVRMLGQLEPTDCLSRLRNLAIIRLMLNTGLRARELRELRTQQIDWRTGRVKIRGKGGRERVLRIARADLILLQDWLAQRPSSNSGASSKLVFTSLDGCRPVCGRWLRKLVRRLADQAGIDKAIHPHTLRHSFATNLLRKEKNIYLVCKALGHADLSTTIIYFHIEDEELEEAMERNAVGG